MDWTTNMAPPTEDTFSITALQQTLCTSISLDVHPFYVITGATIHISQEWTDFITLWLINPCVVKGVDRSTITAIDIGDIKLRIAKGMLITP